MARISFNQQAAAPAVVEEKTSNAASTALVAQQTKTLAAPEYIEDDDFSGELSASSISIPYVSLVHAVSGLAERFEPGAFVYGDEFQLAPKNTPFEVWVVKAALLYKELNSQDNPEDARVFRTAVEVVNAGGQMDNYGADIGYFGPLAQLLFLVKKPATVSDAYDSYFPYTVGGSDFTLAKFSAFKSAYTGVASPIFRLKFQKQPIRGTGWKIQSIFKKGTNSYWVPKASPLAATPDIAEFIESLGI